MNPVLMIVYNNLEMTKKAYASILAQGIGDLRIVMVDNGSTDATWDWMTSLNNSGLVIAKTLTNESPVVLANRWAEEIFSVWGAKHILGLPNDCILPTNCYSELLKFPHGFVSASMDWPDEHPPAVEAKLQHNGYHPAVMLTKKWAHDAVVEEWGFFLDPAYFHYASDTDLKQRTNRMGLLGAQTDLRVWHYGSASWRTAEPSVQREMLAQADRDREVYFQKWGERL